MLHDLSKRQNDWLDRAIAVRESRLAPNARRIDESAEFPRENLDAIRGVGLWGIGVPEDMGGAGVDQLGVGLVCEELARGCASTALAFGLNVSSWWSWAALASHEQARAYIGPGIEKKLLAAHANIERVDQTPLWSVLSRADKALGGWRLSGEKEVVTSAGEADVYWFTARPSTVSTVEAVGLFYLDAFQGGWDVVEEWQAVGLRGLKSGRIAFNRVTVPDDAAFCSDGSLLQRGLKPILESDAATVCACFLGVTQALVDRSLEYVKHDLSLTLGKHREPTGTLRERIGGMQSRVTAARSLLHAALAFCGRIDDLNQELAPLLEARSIVMSTCVDVARETLDLWGPFAYRGEAEVLRCYRDAISAPTTVPFGRWCDAVVGRILLGEPVFG